MAGEKIVIGAGSNPIMTVVPAGNNYVTVNDSKIGYIKNSSSGPGVISQQSTGKVQIVSQVQAKVVVGYEGPQGPQGPQGPAGAGEDAVLDDDKLFDHIDDNNWFEGWAAAGSSPTSAAWKIRRVQVSPTGDVIWRWANGTSSYDKVWGVVDGDGSDGRGTYTYSGIS